MTTQEYMPLEHEVNGDHRNRVLNHKDHEESAEIIEVSPIHNWKRPRLSIEIPSKDLGDTSVRINMPPTPSSASTKVDSCRTQTPTSAKIFISPSPSLFKGKSSIKNLLPRLSFRSRSSATESEKHNVQAPEFSGGQNEEPSVLRSLSFTRLFMPAVRRTSSLPVTPVTILHDNSLPGANAIDHPTLATHSEGLSVHHIASSQGKEHLKAAGRNWSVHKKRLSTHPVASLHKMAKSAALGLDAL